MKHTCDDVQELPIMARASEYLLRCLSPYYVAFIIAPKLLPLLRNQCHGSSPIATAPVLLLLLIGPMNRAADNVIQEVIDNLEIGGWGGLSVGLVAGQGS